MRTRAPTFWICAEPNRLAAEICEARMPRTVGSCVGSGRGSTTIVCANTPEAPLASTTLTLNAYVPGTVGTPIESSGRRIQT